MARSLRSVAPGEKQPKRAPKTAAQAAEDGDTRAMLVAAQARIAAAVDNPNTPPRDLAALTKRLFEVGRDIEAFDARAQQEASESADPGDAPFDASAI